MGNELQQFNTEDKKKMYGKVKTEYYSFPLEEEDVIFT